VALALLEGKTNSEIAAARDTSVRTVANQVGAMFRKLGVHSRPEFVVKLGTEPVERTRRKGESGV
jgi:DNA-binding NarL/FixJ family response regulator